MRKPYFLAQQLKLEQALRAGAATFAARADRFTAPS
jgi:hypothetical protein